MKTLFVILFFLPLISFSQYDIDKAKEKSKTKKNNLQKILDDTYVGADFNLLFGNVFFIYTSPQIGYEFLPNWSAGFNGMYQFYNVQGFYKQNSVGYGLFTRYQCFERLLLETSFNGYKTYINGSEPINAKSWMVGFGYAQPFGNRSYTQFKIQYDILKDVNVPEPIFINTGNFWLYFKFGMVFYLSDLN